MNRKDLNNEWVKVLSRIGNSCHEQYLRKATPHKNNGVAFALQKRRGDNLLTFARI